MTQTIVDMPLEKIVANPQVRQHFDQEADQGLDQSVREVGIILPLRVHNREGQTVILDGERRYRSAKRVGLASVPVIFDDRELSPAEVIQRQLVANCQREDLRPLEKARSIAQLMKATGLSQTQVAGKLGMRDAAVTRSLAILALPAPIKEQVNSGDIPASAAYELARIKDPQQQADMAARLAAGTLTRDGLTGALKAVRAPRPASATAKCPRAIATLGAGQTITVTAANLDIEQFIALLTDALAKARKARTRGVELSTFCRMLKDQAQA